MAVNLDVPYLRQLDNAIAPHQSCNCTSVAMVMKFYGIVGDGTMRGNLADQLLRDMSKKGLDRYLHSDLVKVFAWKGIKDTFTTTGTIAQAKAHLDKGNPVVFSGWFTRSGHIIVLRGYDDKGFFVNDPYSEVFFGVAKRGWRHSYPDLKLSGENLHYSYKGILDVAGGDGKLWLHLPSK